jgi:hypothetical protein
MTKPVAALGIAPKGKGHRARLFAENLPR